MASKNLVLRCQYGGGQRKVLNGLSVASSLEKLTEEVFALTGIAAHRQRVLSGFPPKEIPLENLTTIVSDVGIKSGDTLIIEEKKEQPRVLQQSTVTAHQASFPAVGGSSSGARLVRRVVPADNSCLFASLSYCLLSGEVSFANEIRQCAANCIARDKATYNDSFLGATNDDYCKWLVNPQHWGGAIEINVISKFYQVEINVCDIMSGRVDRYGETETYPNRIFILYDGIHYDPLGLEDVVNPGVAVQTAFPAVDEGILSQALEIAEDAKRKREYTDLSGFSLRCLICSTPLTGQTQAQQHAKTTGHMNFGEVQ